jgi:hypothetical protein
MILNGVFRVHLDISLAVEGWGGNDTDLRDNRLTAAGSGVEIIAPSLIMIRDSFFRVRLEISQAVRSWGGMALTEATSHSHESSEVINHISCIRLCSWG